jgi:hypothetical protein
MIPQIPESVPEACSTDSLAAFSGDPALAVDPEMGPDELWESELNSMLKRQLGWGTAASADIIRRGDKGMGGLARFVQYFVMERGVDASLFEGKLSNLMDAVDKMSVTYMHEHILDANGGTTTVSAKTRRTEHTLVKSTTKYNHQLAESPWSA